VAESVSTLHWPMLRGGGFFIFNKEESVPEYLYPGVYVEEYDAHSRSIPGASTSTDDATARSLVAELSEVIRRVQPEWTDHNPSDPGVTLVELAAFLSEAALYRANVLPEQGRRAVMRAIASLSTLADPCGQLSKTVTRPRFFPGLLLSDADLQAAVDYHREKLRRHNRVLHGIGIVYGLGVRVETAADTPDGRVRIEPGYAIDRCGDEIALGRGVTLALPPSGGQVFVSLRHWDQPRSPVPSPVGETTPSRIEEGCLVSIVDAVAGPAIALAQLHCTEGHWCVDPTFAPPRIFSSSTQP
jgi:hypothetical protein